MRQVVCTQHESTHPQPAQLDHDRHSELVAAAIFLLVATSLAVAVRFWAYRTIGKHWEADNNVIYIAAFRLLLRRRDENG